MASSGEVSITLKNCSGYKLDFYTMLFELEVDGYTGKSGDVLTISVPLSYAGRTVEFYLDGAQSRRLLVGPDVGRSRDR